MTFVSYAQNFEDVLLWPALHDVEHGAYLDVGVQDPVIDSLGLTFFKSGCRGTNAELASVDAPHIPRAWREKVVLRSASNTAKHVKTHELESHFAHERTRGNDGA